MSNRDNGTGWIADYCDREQLPYPEWLGDKMCNLPRHINFNDIKNRYFQFDIGLNNRKNWENDWSIYIIWIVENLESSWSATGKHLWIESEEDAMAFKLGCL